MLRRFCADCESEFLFPSKECDHFRNSICIHCQKERKFGKVIVTAVLRDTRDGHTAIYSDHWIKDGRDEDDFEGGILFQWLDNNYSCDCNRSRFLYPDDESKHLECGSEIIELTKLMVDGKTIYSIAEQIGMEH